MEWDVLMKALDENGDGVIEYKELFDAIWKDKAEFSRGLGAKPTVKFVINLIITCDSNLA